MIEEPSMNGRLQVSISGTLFTCVVLGKLPSGNNAVACRLLDAFDLVVFLALSDADEMLCNSLSSSFRFLMRNSKFVSWGNFPSSSSSSESARSSSMRKPSGFHVKVLTSTLSGCAENFAVDPSSGILS